MGLSACWITNHTSDFVSPYRANQSRHSATVEMCRNMSDIRIQRSALRQDVDVVLGHRAGHCTRSAVASIADAQLLLVVVLAVVAVGRSAIHFAPGVRPRVDALGVPGLPCGEVVGVEVDGGESAKDGFVPSA